MVEFKVTAVSLISHIHDIVLYQGTDRYQSMNVLSLNTSILCSKGNSGGSYVLRYEKLDKVLKNDGDKKREEFNQLFDKLMIKKK